MFDCPVREKQTLTWRADLPIEEKQWSVGLIVGPSGCGKSTVARNIWPTELAKKITWNSNTIVDNFDQGMTVEQISNALSSVGLSTIPAWLRPYEVLSNGEKFRAEMARRLAEHDETIVVDEFTSVVDRQIAKIVCHSVQKQIRKLEKRFVAITCHEDVVDWLQPDWVFRPDLCDFQWRLVRRRPSIEVKISRLPYEAWSIFSRYHYLTAELNRSAQCFGLWANGRLACFAGVLHRPHAKTKNIKGVSRLVTLPDWQGLGLAFVLSETLEAAYAAKGIRFRNYPAHPSFVRAYRKEKWLCVRRPGEFSGVDGRTSSLSGSKSNSKSRPCAVMEYVGEKMEINQAMKLLEKIT